MHRMLRDSFERGDQTFDLGAGYLEAKRHWHTAERYSYRSTHFASPPPRPAPRAKRWLREWVSDDAAPCEAEHPNRAAAC